MRQLGKLSFGSVFDYFQPELAVIVSVFSGKLKKKDFHLYQNTILKKSHKLFDLKKSVRIFAFKANRPHQKLSYKEDYIDNMNVCSG